MSTITYGMSGHGSPVHGYRNGAARDAGRHLRLVPMPAVDAPRLRLTRRGRVAVAAVALLAIGSLAIVLGPSGAASDQAGAPQQFTTVSVQPGQTVWDIAAKANPRGDIRDTVDQIIKLNALESAGGLQMGAQLAVPVYH